MKKLATLLTVALAASAAAQTPLPANVARVHYQRADHAYAGWGLHAWEDTAVSVDWAKPIAQAGRSDWGAYFDIPLKAGAQKVGIIVHKGDQKDHNVDLWFDLSRGRELFVKSGSTLVAYAKGAPLNVDAAKAPVVQAAPAKAATATSAQGVPQGVLRVRYLRPDGKYEGWGLHAWEDTTASVEWTKPLTPTGVDAGGAYWDLPLKAGASKVGFIVHKGDEKDPGADMFADLTKGREVLVTSGKADFAYVSADPPVPAGATRINYFRPDGKYEGWGLHTWEDAAQPTTWTAPLNQTGQSSFGVYWDVPMKTDWKKLGLIIHKGDEKDPGPDMFLNREQGQQAWIVSGQPTLHTTRPDTSVRRVGDLTRQQAIMVSRDLIAVKPDMVQPGALLTLHASSTAGLTLTPAGVQGGDALTLEEVPAGLSAAQRARTPHLANYKLLQVRAEDRARLPEALRGQLAVSSVMPDGSVLGATSVQTARALDDLYAYSGPLGVTWQGAIPTVRLWAPTAQNVALRISKADGTGERTVPMTRSAQGVWTASGDASWKGMGYRFEVKVFAPSTGKIETNLVTDPYSVGLSLNSTRSLFVDLGDAAHTPAGWAALRKPALRSVSDLSFYELHLRDFSAADASVPAAQRGTYLAFTQAGSHGMKHLKSLADAGLKAVHLLPTFDIATINEDKGQWKFTPDLSRLAPGSEEQQKAITAIKDADPYNWGYDPYHFMVPEGSYAVRPDQRALEYRQMVMALNNAGLRVVQDVVFNHTNASGQAERSVLDRIVPGYYHRLNADGAVETSTCCANTATEHTMMRKLMVDTLVLMARAYKVDGFRFDLMGHHMLADMQAARQALDALTVQKDGVDGRQIYLYGEGWDFGEVEKNRRGVNATQLNLFGQGIGTFNDRIRDAIRGGNPFGGLRDQGFATGLFTLPNGLPQNTNRDAALRLADHIRVGLTGNLRDYRFTGASGQAVKGADLPYGAAPVGYAAAPRETVNYASAHDNQTLWDAVLLKAPANATTAQRVRMQNLAHSLILLGQGLPFSYAGDEMLRSKSFDTDSYNSGDWFNTLDFTRQTNGFGKGLPPAEKNAANWDLYRPILANPAMKVTPSDIARASDHYREMLRVRYSSTLFRMASAQEVQQNLTFLNVGPQQTPGLIAMKLSGAVTATNPFPHLVVVFNATGKTVTFSDPKLAGLNLRLHPVLAASTDPVVKSSQASGTSVTVPALTTAVFVGR
ncbi:pullulanase-type alpha-1,6-glucosidase [Deinococcus deserti]|uniref:pullulanase n=1 Tax=Deinococcus deserti (strain DSM 17065 / CIP 109153 / LMG 22923 / VCD115) TaxID=546414 RepID=C1CWA0_DEIDV|nr:pullulanase-type alpha-1,6-glucosidase [Deinococcus deserti]ACO46467.1 putative Pullulanase precursor (Alpha-dextrin endo-1,6-alpha-glucosidase)(Pullulan 6-glucanohydrolase) [Deinococcus deserti VCD115]